MESFVIAAVSGGTLTRRKEIERSEESKYNLVKRFINSIQ